MSATMGKFHIDLATGNYWEKEFAKYLMSNSPVLYENPQYCDTSDYDLKIYCPDNQAWTTFEIKADEYTTGNFAFELACMRREKPTGLWVTKANYFVVIFTQARIAYAFHTESLRRYIREEPLAARTVTNGGDNNKSIIALIPIEYLSKKPWVKMIKI